MAKWTEKIKENHSLMMILCCSIPLVVLASGAYFFGLSKTYLTWFVILLCPIMHIFMMRDMHKDHEDDKDNGGGRGSRMDGKKRKGGCH